jgi:hypothetical protein
MAEQIVSFPPEVNEKVGQYCIDHSVSLPGYFKEHKEFTEQNVRNTGKKSAFSCAGAESP